MQCCIPGFKTQKLRSDTSQNDTDEARGTLETECLPACLPAYSCHSPHAAFLLRLLLAFIFSTNYSLWHLNWGNPSLRKPRFACNPYVETGLTFQLMISIFWYVINKVHRQMDDMANSKPGKWKEWKMKKAMLENQRGEEEEEAYGLQSSFRLVCIASKHGAKFLQSFIKPHFTSGSSHLCSFSPWFLHKTIPEPRTKRFLPDQLNPMRRELTAGIHIYS